MPLPELKMKKILSQSCLMDGALLELNLSLACEYMLMGSVHLLFAGRVDVKLEITG